MARDIESYVARFEAYLQSHEAQHVLYGPFSIRKWMRFAGISTTQARVNAIQEVLNDWVSDGRMIKGLADFGCGFARGTMVYEIVPKRASQALKNPRLRASQSNADGPTLQVAA